MAIGKNKKLGKKKGQKKVQDPFAKKEWYHVRAPAVFPVRAVGRTIATKSSGNKLARDTLIGRVFTVSQGDLSENGGNGDACDAFRQFKLRVEEVQGKYCLTNFHGMRLARDKLCALVRKWHSLIESSVDVKTSDGFTLRIFVIGFTSPRPNQNRKTSYAQSAQVRKIRRRMSEVVEKEVSGVSTQDITKKLCNGEIGQLIEKATQGIYPLQNCFVRKVKVLRAPKSDISRLMEAHGGAAGAIPKAKPVERVEEEAAEEEADVEMAE